MPSSGHGLLLYLNTELSWRGLLAIPWDLTRQRGQVIICIARFGNKRRVVQK